MRPSRTGDSPYLECPFFFLCFGCLDHSYLSSEGVKAEFLDPQLGEHTLVLSSLLLALLEFIGIDCLARHGLASPMVNPAAFWTGPSLRPAVPIFWQLFFFLTSPLKKEKLTYN